jgi:2-oxoisovalerate dehydrogenase E2 component (dihydrolipoyl transacylase)
MDVLDDTQGDVNLGEEVEEQSQPEVQIEKGDIPAREAAISTKSQMEGKDDRQPRSTVLVTPAIQHMLKEANISINEVKGTGKDGRITKDDVQRHISASKGINAQKTSEELEPMNDQEISLTPTENAMFAAMTESLKIPHFLFTHTIDFTGLNERRSELNARTKASEGTTSVKLTPLPFIMKAISQALLQFPKLNSHLDTVSNHSKPRLLLKRQHNFGLAIDTPKGLLVPVVRGVERHSIQSLAAEIWRLNQLAQAGRLAPDHFRNATFIVSNIGSIGGDAVAPVILAPMVGIVGIGRTRQMPVFVNAKGREEVVKREQITLSWSADHRVVDGATVARTAKLVEDAISDVERMNLEIG